MTITRNNASATTCCADWTKGDPVLMEYHDDEWCRVRHDDRFEFEMLCLEAASVGLSWRTILYKRDAYRQAFHDFDIARCAAMTDDELETLLENRGLVRNRGKIFSVRSNARAVLEIQRIFGSFDTYLWSFTSGAQIVGSWHTPNEIPTHSELSHLVSADMKKRGIKYMGPVITYSFLQSIGIVNDHLADCPHQSETTAKA